MAWLMLHRALWSRAIGVTWHTPNILAPTRTGSQLHGRMGYVKIKRACSTLLAADVRSTSGYCSFAWQHLDLSCPLDRRLDPLTKHGAHAFRHSCVHSLARATGSRRPVVNLALRAHWHGYHERRSADVAMNSSVCRMCAVSMSFTGCSLSCILNTRSPDSSYKRASVLSLGVCENRDGWLVAWGFCG